LLKRSLDADNELRDFDAGPVVSALQLFVSKHARRNGVVIGGTENENGKERKNKYQQNKFFFPALRQVPLDNLLVAWRGFAMSVRPTWKQLSVNINVATSAFHQEGNLAQALSNFRGRTFGAEATKFFFGVQVKLIHLGYRKKIAMIGNKTATQFTFPYSESPEAPMRQISVAQFFRTKYNFSIKFPDLPVVNVGNKNKAIWVPAEICEILPKQPFKGKLSAEQTRKMLDIATLAPNQSQGEIMQNGLKALGISPLIGALQSVGVEIGGEMATVPGRILPSPSLEYRNKKPAQVRDGAWNLVGSKFNIAGQKLGECGVLLLSDGPENNYKGGTDPALLKSLDAFSSVCTKYGLDATGVKWKPAMVQLKDLNSDPTREIAMSGIRALFAGKFKPQIVLVIMSREDKIYNLLKHYLDTVKDIHSVCSLYLKFRKDQDQYFANLSMKFNAKLGGVNHIVTGRTMDKLKERGTMFVGADVTHPSFLSLPGTPSIAGVVASSDNTFARYPVSLRLQQTKKEMITEVDSMLIERLKAYELKVGRGKFPSSIIFVRDGVSESQFLTVLNEELPKIRDACSRVSTNYKPKITLVIAGKRCIGSVVWSFHHSPTSNLT